MAWSSDDWEPWVIFAACLVCTAVLSALVALFCYRRSRPHRFNQVDVLFDDKDARAKTGTNGFRHVQERSANAFDLISLPRSAIRLTTRLSDGRFGQRHNAMLVSHEHITTLYTRAIQVEEPDKSKFTHAEVSHLQSFHRY
jgi:hypothetical protein